MIENLSTPVAIDSATATTLRQLIMGFRTTQIIAVAARLGLPDALAIKPQTPEQLAPQLNVDGDALYRLLRALGSLGLVAETGTGSFELTALGHGLRSDLTGSVRNVALLYGEEWLWQAYSRLEYSVATGQPAFDQVHGQPLYGYLTDHPEANSTFQAAMSGFSSQEVNAILDAYNFTPARQVVDVGGGQGLLLQTILAAHPTLQGILFDLPPVVAGALAGLRYGSLGQRCTLIGGDFFHALPPGGDLYLLKSVIHNWGDRQAQAILRRCREAIEPHGRLLVIERLIPPGNTPSEAKLFNINMLVVGGGRERSKDEYAALFAAAGFQLTRILPTASALSIIEGLPAEPGPTATSQPSS